MDVLDEALEKYFASGDAVRHDRENLNDFEQRIAVHFRDIKRALAELDSGTSEVPSEIYGWFLLNKHVRLDASDIATLKAQTSGYKLSDVWVALRRMWGGDSLSVKDQDRRRTAKAYMAAVGEEKESWKLRAFGGKIRRKPTRMTKPSLERVRSGLRKRLLR